MFLTIDFIPSIVGVGGNIICEYQGKHEYF